MKSLTEYISESQNEYTAYRKRERKQYWDMVEKGLVVAPSITDKWGAAPGVDYYYDADDSNPGYIVYNNDDVDKTTIAADFLNKLEKHGYKVRKQYDEKHPNWLLVTRK